MKLILPPGFGLNPSTDNPEPGPSELDALAAKLSLKTRHGVIFLHYMLRNTQLMDAKQQDYGPSNIAKFGTPGIIIRMSDKMERLITLTQGKRRRPRNESIRDTLQDISVYGGLALMCEDNQWPTS